MSVSLFALKVILALAIVGYLVICGLLYVYQARFLFPGAFTPLPSGVEAEGRRLGLEPVTLGTADGESPHLLARAPEPGRQVILVFHGNASYPEDYGFLYTGWIVSGYGIVAPVSRGYPRSSGAPDGEAMLADALAVRDWIARKYPDSPIMVFGQSLGTGQALHVAANREVAGVILVSPFFSMLALVGEKMPWLPTRLLLTSPFRSDLDIGRVKAPILIFHGDGDTLIPIGHGKALAALAKAAVTFKTIQGAGHAQGLFSSTMIEGISTFVKENSP